MLKSVFALALASFVLSIPAVAAEVPRAAPQFAFQTMDGKTHHLSDYKGKVLMVVIFSPTCPHCKALTQSVLPMYGSYAAKGLQVVEVAMEEMKTYIPAFAQEFNPPFPVGYAPRDNVYSLMQTSFMERFMVPQGLLIDKNGVIQKQFAPGDPAFQSVPKSLTDLIDPLLTQSGSKAPRNTGAKRPAPTKTASVK